MFKLNKIKPKNKNNNHQAGMSYVELVVVLSIFAVMTSIVLFNYGDFQVKVDIKNLASDIALKVVEAQKSSLSGKLPPLAQRSQIGPTWKPSYGVYFNLAADNKSFIYFVDLNQDGFLDSPACAPSSECLDEITITKGNIISNLTVFYQGGGAPLSFNDLTITFKRPGSKAIMVSSVPFTGIVDYVQATIASPKGVTSIIKLYLSGRIEVI